MAQFAVYAGTIINARGEPLPIVNGWNEMNMTVDLAPELNRADLTNFAKDQWEFAFQQKGQEFLNKPYAVATIEKDLPKAFSTSLMTLLKKQKTVRFTQKDNNGCRRERARQTQGGRIILESEKAKANSSYGRDSKGSGYWGN